MKTYTVFALLSVLLLAVLAGTHVGLLFAIIVAVYSAPLVGKRFGANAL